MKLWNLVFILVFQNGMALLKNIAKKNVKHKTEINQPESVVQSNNITNLNDLVKVLEEKSSKLQYSDFKTLSHKYTGDAEEFDVVTEDNYILKVFHIKGKKGKEVLIGHGILSSSDDFLVRGNISLVYMLVQERFDVWVMNFRGNRYSRRHKTLNPDEDREFWDFGLNELGYYDFPAVVDFVLNKTGQKQLSIIGHSQATSSSFIMTSTRPEYNDKIKICITLAPVAFLSEVEEVSGLLFELYPIVLQELFDFLKMYEFLGFISFLKHLFNLICLAGRPGYIVCTKILSNILLGPSRNVEYEFLPRILEHFPAGTSNKDVGHNAQIYRSGRFAKYDYGDRNNKIYGSQFPPEYNLGNVKCKFALFTSLSDGITSIKETNRIKNNLPNVVNVTIIRRDARFNHADYLWGWNAHKVLYPHVIELLYKYLK